MNPERPLKQCGGKKRRLIGSEALETELLTQRVLQKMAPLSISRRLDYIRQKYGVECTPWLLKRFY